MFVFTFVAGLLPAVASRQPAFVSAMLVAAALPAAGALVPWRRLPAWTEALVPMAFAIGEVLLRESRGGVASGYAAQAVLPAVWFGLYGTRAQSGVAVAVVAAGFSAPILFLDLPIED